MTTTNVETLRSRAEELFDTGNMADAEVAYREILDADGKDADAYYMLGVILVGKSDATGAAELFTRAIAADPDHTDSYYMLAGIAQTSEDYNEALNYCLQATTLDPEFGDAWLLLCNISTQCKNNDQAIASCAEASKHFPGIVQATINLAGAHFNAGNFAEAARIFHDATDQDPKIFDSWKYRALSEMNNQDYESAASSLKMSKEYFPDHVELLNVLTDVFMAQGLVDQARNVCEGILKSDQGNIDACIKMGNILYHTNKYNDAISWYEKARVAAPDQAEIYHNIGISHLILKEKEKAAACFREALKLDTTLVGTRHMLAAIEGDNLDRADNQYVAELFDNYAIGYDKAQKTLEYKVPGHLNDVVREVISNHGLSTPLDFLDLGCGTGLCAPYIKDISKLLVGVDLSPVMIKEAAKLDLYTSLVADDIAGHMNENPDTYDIALAGDVFVYIGALENEFQAARVSLKENGFLIFSVQVNDRVDQFELSETGRYNHSGSYISDLAKAYRFTEIGTKDIVSRLEDKKPVKARIHILRK